MKKNTILLFVIGCLFFASCSKDNKESVDTEYPVIDISAANSFPVQCSEIRRGQTFTFRALVTDNAELGSVSVDIHHNFDHHSHSTEVNSCNMDPQKTAVNPFLLVRTIAIPAGLKNHEIANEIAVPANVDPGDYHFLIRLTDTEGWQTIKGISIKVV